MTEHSPAQTPADTALTPHEVAQWQQTYARIERRLGAEVAGVVDSNARRLAELFYDTLLVDPDASALLSHELVARRLHDSLQAWLRELFCSDSAPDIEALIRRQKKVGQVHARVHIPIQLVARGARILKAELAGLLRATPLSRDDLSLAQQFVDELLDTALESMNAAFVHDSKRGIRADEAYRLFTLGQNVSAERERQRAALLDWAHVVLTGLYMQREVQALPALRASEFGLWIHHKGSAMFQGTDELPRIREIVARLDGEILPLLVRDAANGNGAGLTGDVTRFQQGVSDIKHLVGQLFDRMAEVDAGRDPLTQMLNRRFLPSVLLREIEMAIQDQTAFSVLMVDVDHFKSINDRHGHAGGDYVLRQVADLLQDHCRSSDYVFRYGGEEFLMVLVDTAMPLAGQLSEKILQASRDRMYKLPDGTTTAVTLSIGVAAFDGHPDSDRIVARADQALYLAKRQGRDRWACPDDESEPDGLDTGRSTAIAPARTAS